MKSGCVSPFKSRSHPQSDSDNQCPIINRLSPFVLNQGSLQPDSMWSCAAKTKRQTHDTLSLRLPPPLPQLSILSSLSPKGKSWQVPPASCSGPAQAAAQATHSANIRLLQLYSQNKQDTPRSSWPLTHLPGEEAEERGGGHGSQQTHNKRITYCLNMAQRRWKSEE